MSHTSTKGTRTSGKHRHRWRRPLAAVAIGSLGVVGLSGPAEATTSEHHFEGAISGGEVVTGGDERCSFLGNGNFSDSGLLAFKGKNGEDWGQAAHSCGTIGGQPLRVSIAGNLTIWTPHGQLRGTFGDSFAFPVSPDYVRVNHINGGTGDFEGATGTCLYSDLVFTPTGTNSNSITGNVTCDITSPK